MQSNNLIRISAAGAGKTYGICNDALSIVQCSENDNKVLIVSYTNRGVEAIETEIKKQNCGVLHPEVIVLSWYSFLLSEMIKPFQSFLFTINEIRSFDFSATYGTINYKRIGTRERYINKHGDIRSNEAAELALQLNIKSGNLVIKRLETIYSNIFIDEIQDMAGYDLDIIEILMHSAISIVCVGDNKQATFKTNNARKNKGKSGTNVWEFFAHLYNTGRVAIEQNQVSRRFNNEICAFANSIYPNENNMTTSMRVITGHDGVFVICREDVAQYYAYFKPIVLRYNVKTKTDVIPAINFGACKGLTFNRILIYPNGPMSEWLFNDKALKSPQKYYVAVTRPKYSIAFVVDSLPEGEKYQNVIIELDDTSIAAKRVIMREGYKNA